MSTNQITKAKGLFGSIAFRNDGGAALKGIYHAEASVNPAEIAAGADGDVAITITGVAEGDLVILEPAPLTEGLVLVSAAPVLSANTATVTILNTTAGAIDEAAANWRYTWFDLT